MLVKTHLIITEQNDDYEVKWHGRLIDTNPDLSKNGVPIFIIISSCGRIELNTIDMLYIEKIAKKFTQPKGRGALTKDTANIYIKEADGNEKLIGCIVHNHIRKYAPMYDEIGG